MRSLLSISQTWIPAAFHHRSSKQTHQVNQHLVALAVNHRKEIFKRWIAIVNNLSVILHLVATQTGCLSLFLGKVEMMAQFDPVMREHLRVIWAKDPSNTCLSKHFQNDLTWFNINNLPCVHTYIVERVEKAKFYAVKPVFNVTKGASLCTSVLLRIVNCESSNVPVHEHFVVVFFTWHNRKRLMWVF